MKNDKQQPPDRDYIISILNYDSNTGIFVWKQRVVKSNKTNNSINRKLGISKSGYIGVTKYSNGQRWKASITVNKQVIELGVFVNKQDAITARKQAEIKYGFDKIIFAREI